MQTFLDGALDFAGSLLAASGGSVDAGQQEMRAGAFGGHFDQQVGINFGQVKASGVEGEVRGVEGDSLDLVHGAPRAFHFWGGFFRLAGFAKCRVIRADLLEMIGLAELVYGERVHHGNQLIGPFALQAKFFGFVFLPLENRGDISELLGARGQRRNIG